MATVTKVTVRPSMQLRVAGVSMGLMAVKPDAQDPEAVLGLSNPDKGVPEQHRVRPGDHFEVAGRHFEVIGITPDPGRVELLVSWEEPA